MSMKALEELRNGLCEELEEYAREYKNKPHTLTVSDLEKIHHLSGTVVKLDKIIYGDGEGGHSHGDWEACGTYGDDSSYAHRGMRHDGEMSERRDRRGRYSHDSGKDHMMKQLYEMMEDATTERQRSAIHRCMEQLENE